MSDLTVKNLHVSLEGVPIIQGLTLEVPDRHAVAVLGHNGAGKTTLMRSIMGLAGNIEFRDCPVGWHRYHPFACLGTRGLRAVLRPAIAKTLSLADRG